MSPIERLEAITYDARVRLAARFPTAISSNLAVVFIDDAAFRRVNSGELGFSYLWPWPRFLYGKAVRELKAQGATAVGIDILFADSYPDSEATAVTEVRNGLEIVTQSDDFFAESLKTSGQVILAAEEGALPHPKFRNAAMALGSVQSNPDFGVLRRVRPFSFQTVVHPKLEELRVALDLNLDSGQVTNGVYVLQSASGDAEPVKFKLRADGTLDLTELGEVDERPQPPVRPERVWNLGIALAAQELGLDLTHPIVRRGSITLKGEKTSLTLPLDKDGMFLVDWSLKFDTIARGKTAVHVGDIVSLLLHDKAREQGEIPAEAPFKDRLVLIGSTATGNNYSDLGATPLEAQAPLMTKHLNIANSILTGRFIQRAPVWLELLLTIAFGALAASLTWRSRVLVAFAVIALTAVAYIAAACLLYVQARYWLPIVLPLGGGLALPHFSMVTYRLLFEQRERRHVTDVFRRIVSPAVVNDLISAESLALGGARREITIYFADVRGFTEFTDHAQALAEAYVREHNLDSKAAEEYYNVQAAEMLNVVNTYLATIADVIKKHNGTLDKYIGDCVMAFWGAPTDNPTHAVACVRAAIEAQERLLALNSARIETNRQRTRLNEMRLGSGRPPVPLLPILTVGTGINTGPATVGLMGSDAHILNYTVFGREVNVAARLEGISGKSRIIISEATFKHLLRDDPALAAICAPLEPVHVKGIAASVNIYEVRWQKSAAPVPDQTSIAVA